MFIDDKNEKMLPKMSFEKEMEISKEASLDEIEEYTM